MYRCEHHPKYNGQKELKSKSRKECKGCNKVRQEYLSSLKGQNKQGNGSFSSLTTPDFQCGLVHLLVEIAVIMNYGMQTSFFWRAKTSSPKHVKDFYKKYYPIFQRHVNSIDSKPLYNALCKTVMSAKAAQIRNNMGRKHEKYVENTENSKIMDILESDKPISGMFKEENLFWDED